MECCIEIAEPIIDFKFQLKRDAQKYLIEYILSYSVLDCKQLAQMLEASPLVLGQVLAGKEYLEPTKAINLFQYFAMMLGVV